MIRLKSLIQENVITFPITVQGSFKGRNCDEFHAFNDTGGRVIGGMNNKVNAKLEEVYNAGYNPTVTAVSVSMDNKTYSVNWSVTINESTDGNAWIGFYSRGAGGSDAVKRGAPITGNHTSPAACRTSKAIKRRGSIKDISMLLDYTYNPPKGCKVRQIFYKYTLSEWPAKGNTQNAPKSSGFKFGE